MPKMRSKREWPSKMNINNLKLKVEFKWLLKDNQFSNNPNSDNQLCKDNQSSLKDSLLCINNNQAWEVHHLSNKCMPNNNQAWVVHHLSNQCMPNNNNLCMLNNNNQSKVEVLCINSNNQFHKILKVKGRTKLLKKLESQERKIAVAKPLLIAVHAVSGIFLISAVESIERDLMVTSTLRDLNIKIGFAGATPLELLLHSPIKTQMV
jgi:hypothetical protein